MDNKPGSKREKISKAQKITLLEVLGASLVVGVCLVMINFLGKYIGFNTKVINGKNEAITEYDQTLRNAGICEDVDKNMRLSDAEIENCRPNATELSKVTESLRYNVYERLAQNQDLEKVARKRDENGVCYTEDGQVENFTKKYQEAITDKERGQALLGMRMCSSLRVISDALPNNRNEEALMASLNQLFLLAEVEPESMSPSQEVVSGEVAGISAIPVSFRMSGTGPEVMNLLDTLDRSIREFDIKTATVEWTSKGLSLRVSANAYYLTEEFQPEMTRMIRATDPGDGTRKGGK